MKRYTNTALSLAVALILAGCTEEGELLTPGENNAPNSGIVSQKNFSVLTSDISPNAYNLATGEFTSKEATITAFIGDRNNVVLTDPKTIFFEVDYGLIQPSCVTSDGSCSVTWIADKIPTSTAGGANGQATVTAYTIGEEAFTDANGNGTYDDGETFFETTEPFIDFDNNGVFTTGDLVIDTVNSIDATGSNGLFDATDGLFNGNRCTHSTACSTQTTITVFASVRMNVSVQAYSIGGNVSGLPGGQTLTITMNGTGLDVTSNGNYSFPNLVEDGSSYSVTVTTPPATAPNCTFDNGNSSGTVSGGNVTNVDITCAP